MEQFLEKSKNKHDNKFDYSKSNFKTYTRCKILVKCNIHNHEFLIEPYNHLRQKNGGCNFSKFTGKKSKSAPRK